MQVQNILKYSISIIILLLLCGSVFAQEETDSTAVDNIQPAGHQLRIGVEVSKPISGFLQDNRNAYEFEVDYYWKKEGYLVAEGGFGNATVNYTDLSYTANNSFVKLGYNKSMLKRVFPGDWDMAFIGLRYCMSFINRGTANYTITDSTWGSVSGTIPAESLTGHWAEVVGGVRVEMYKGIFLGWTVRGKFLLNQKQFEELPPAYVAGYGKGDKNTIFDFNFYLCYAIRWGNKKAAEKPL